jgi:hypothetical protein
LAAWAFLVPLASAKEHSIHDIQAEYEKSLEAYMVGLNGTNEFSISFGDFGEIFTLEEEHNVIVNPLDQIIVSHSCRLFERVGILCRHVGMH